MEKKKKRLIILSVVAGVLVFLILLSSAIFRIKGVSVEYQTTLTLLSKQDLNVMVENADLPMGKNIFFSSLDDNMAKMEKANPYVKINGIERKFPNSLVVLVSERVPVVQVKYNDCYYILDSELKVLNVVPEASPGEYIAQTGEKDLPYLELSKEYALSLDGVTKGDFIANEQVQKFVDAFYRGSVTPSKDNADVAISLISTIKTIKVSYKAELKKVQFDLTYKGDLGLTSTIIGDNNLVDNIYKVMAVVNYDITHDEVSYSQVNCTDGVVYAKEVTE